MRKIQVEKEIGKIRRQLEVNLSYFTGNNKVTLQLLQSHVYSSLDVIEKLMEEN